MSSTYKYCFVPYCTNTTKSTPNKIFVVVPRNEERRKNWFQAVRRVFNKDTTFYCCEDHFNFQNDMENYMKFKMLGGKIFLKKHVVPHIFNWPETSNTKKRKLDSFVESEPSTSRTTEEVLDMKFNVGTQCSPNVSDNYQQTQLCVKDVSVSCNIQITKQTVKVDTSDLYFYKDIATSPLKKKKTLYKEESITEETTEGVQTGSDFIPKSDSGENQNVTVNVPQILHLIEKFPKRYIGVSKNWHPTLINLLNKHSKIKKEHILLCLMKIKLNDSFARLADQFFLSVSGASQIFRSNIQHIYFYLRKNIYWPEPDIIKYNLPIPFRGNYSEVQSIIDCLEIQIEKPSNPVEQSLSWSQYKKCNTIKYLISCTPNGFINFVSTGFSGRISDTLLMEKCEYLKVLPKNCVVMADRGFKEVEQLLRLKNNCTLLRPPSVSSSVKPTKEEVLETKRIASLRIHVERVIGRLREFAFLKPHSVVDHNLIFYTDVIIGIACALCNLQSPLIKS